MVMVPHWFEPIDASTDFNNQAIINSSGMYSTSTETDRAHAGRRKSGLFNARVTDHPTICCFCCTQCEKFQASCESVFTKVVQKK